MGGHLVSGRHRSDYLVDQGHRALPANNPGGGVKRRVYHDGKGDLPCSARCPACEQERQDIARRQRLDEQARKGVDR
jgi:hypothetical protein